MACGKAFASHDGHPAFLEQHLDRLYEGAKAIALDIGLDRDALTRAIYATLAANGMHDGVHVRLMVTRGVKRTPYQDPRVTIGPATIVIIPEYKNPLPDTSNTALTLFTVHVRRGYPDVQDPKLNSHSKLNCITACIQAYTAGADEALMLDPHGFVATCNSTHFFIVRKGEVWTSTASIASAASRAATCSRSAARPAFRAFEKILQPDRRLWRRRSVRHRHVRRRRAGAHDRRAHDRRRATRADGRTAAIALPRAGRARYRRTPAAGRRRVTEPLRIAMWSGPRNISTAMMRAWENRGDCAVSDEPLYAHYLAHTGADHPGRDEVIAAGDVDWRERDERAGRAGAGRTGRSGIRSR